MEIQQIQVFITISFLLYDTTTALLCPLQCICSSSTTQAFCSTITDQNAHQVMSELPSTILQLTIHDSQLHSMENLYAAPQLEKLSIVRSGIQSTRSMQIYANVRHLQLTQNNISRLGSNDLSAFPSVNILDLSDNQISHLEWDSLRLFELRTLYLTHNNLTFLHPHALRQVQRLEKLDLSYNEITTIPSTTYILSSNLKHLNLSHNRIADLEGESLLSLTKLTMLDLSSNSLLTIPNRNLRALDNLHSLFIGGNQLISINSGDFDHLNQLKVVDLQNSQELRFILAKSMRMINVESINLNNCSNLKFISPHAFEGARRLHHLQLRSTNLRHLDESLWTGNRTIDLTDCKNLNCACMHSTLFSRAAPNTITNQCEEDPIDSCGDELITYPDANSTKYITVGSELDMYCVSLLNTTHILWNKPHLHAELPSSRHGTQGEVNRIYRNPEFIRITLVTASDTGEYKCSLGDTKVKKTINLVVTQPNIGLQVEESGVDYVSLAWNATLNTRNNAVRCYIIYRQARSDNIPTLPRIIQIPLRRPWMAYMITRLRPSSNYSFCLSYVYNSNITLYNTCLDWETPPASRIGSQLNFTALLLFILLLCSSCLICSARCLHRKFYIWQESKYRARIALSISGQSFLSSSAHDTTSHYSGFSNARGTARSTNYTNAFQQSHQLHVLSNSSSRMSCQNNGAARSSNVSELQM